MMMTVAGCENPMDGEFFAVDDENPNVTLRFTPYQQESFTRATAPLEDQLSRLSVAVFRQDGTKVGSTKNQKAEDKGFGTVRLSLDAGTYTVVAIAHNGLGNATISSATEVKFANNKMTDTFAYCGRLTVGEEQPTEQDVRMTRCVAMVRLTLTDATLPEGVDYLQFYYTGGSSTYDPTTGFGSKASRQTELRDCYDADGEAIKTYEIYTLPHEAKDELTLLRIKVFDASGQELEDYTTEMTKVPIERNKITTWTGSLFDGSGTTTGGYTVTLDTDWSGTIQYTF